MSKILGAPFFVVAELSFYAVRARPKSINQEYQELHHLQSFDLLMEHGPVSGATTWRISHS